MRKTAKKFGALLLALCMVIGLVPTLISTAEATEDPRVTFVTQQLALGDDLTMKYTLGFDAAIQSTATVKITVDGSVANYNVSELSLTSNQYTFEVDVAAAQMTENILIEVYNGGSLIADRTYTVRSYAVSILTGEYSNKTKALVKELLNYGAAAQQYFDVNTENLANAGYELASSAAVPATAYTNAPSGSVSGVTYAGATLLFKGKMGIRYYFDIPAGLDGLTFTIGGASYEAMRYSGDRYVVDVNGINPQDIELDKSVTVTDGVTTLTVTYSPLAYIVRKYNSGTDANLTALVQALYGYHTEAEEYVLTGGYDEIDLPAASVMITDFSGDPGAVLWQSASTSSATWHGNAQGAAGVLELSVDNTAVGDGNSYPSARHVIAGNSLSYSSYKYLVIRLMFTHGAPRAIYLGAFNGSGNPSQNILSYFTAQNPGYTAGTWATVKVPISELTYASFLTYEQGTKHYIGFANQTKKTQKMYIDQIYLSCEEEALPTGAVLVTDFSSDPGAAAASFGSTAAHGTANWHEVYDGTAGVQALGFDTTGSVFTLWKNLLPTDFDYSSYKYINFRIKVSSKAGSLLYFGTAPSPYSYSIAANSVTTDAWATITIPVATLRSYGLGTDGFGIGQGGNGLTTTGDAMILLDQVYLTAEEVALPNGAVLINDFSSDPGAVAGQGYSGGTTATSGTATWSALASDRTAGVLTLGTTTSSRMYTLWTNLMNTDATITDYTYLNIRLKVVNTSKTYLIYVGYDNKSGGGSAWATPVSYSVSSNGLTSNTWTTIQIPTSSLTDPHNYLGGTYWGIGFASDLAGDVLLIDQIYLSN